MNEEIKETPHPEEVTESINRALGIREGLWAYLKRRTFTVSLADVALVFLALAAVDLAFAIVDGIFNDW